MGKVKTVIMGDEQAEEKARAKAATKREQKKAEKAKSKQTRESEKSKVISDWNGDKEEVASEITNGQAPITNADLSSTTLKKSKKQKTDTKYKPGPGKKYSAAVSLIDKSKAYPISDAISLVKKTSFSKFDGSVELHINVSDKGIRGTVALPHGTGKQVRVRIADDKLIADLSASGKIDFDILVASPEMMPKLARVAKILGPKGLMPNPKTGTIGSDTEKLVKQLSAGQVQWKTQNDFPIVHAVIGKVSFEDKKIEDNFHSLIKSIGKDKIKSVFMKASMGPSVKITL
jgi:large subunit ribosomal protein L1